MSLALSVYETAIYAPVMPRVNGWRVILIALRHSPWYISLEDVVGD